MNRKTFRPTLLVMALAALALVGVAVAAMTPKQIVTKLYTTPVLKSEIPAGVYETPKVTLGKASRGAVGQVYVEMGTEQGVSYTIYPSAATASKRMAEKKLYSEEIDVSDVEEMGRAPGYGKQSHLFVGPIHGENAFGKKVTNGFTGIEVMRGPVVILAMSFDLDAQSGDVQVARKMASFAVKHLARVTKP